MQKLYMLLLCRKEHGRIKATIKQSANVAIRQHQHTLMLTPMSSKTTRRAEAKQIYNIERASKLNYNYILLLYYMDVVVRFMLYDLPCKSKPF